MFVTEDLLFNDDSPTHRGMDSTVVLERTGFIKRKAIGAARLDGATGRSAHIAQIVDYRMGYAVIVGPSYRTALLNAYLGRRKHHIFNFYTSRCRCLIGV